MTAVSSQQRHTRTHRCPVCGGADQDPRGKDRRCSGFDSPDGKWAFCSRVQSDQEGPNGTWRHLVRDEHDEAPPGIVEAYPYLLENGALEYEQVRKFPKGFFQRPAGAVRRVPYRLPKLLAADPSTPVYLPEGEKDVHTLEGLGLLATTNSHGAESWDKSAGEFAKALAGRDVVVLADRDEPGRRRARDAEATLRPVARSVRVLEPPEGFKDVTDLIESGRTLDELVDLPPLASSEPSNGAPDENYVPPRIDGAFARSLERARRRACGIEKPIPLPFPILEPHFGGGLWPGLHVVNKSTGVGGTQLALQIAKSAAKADIPSLYIGLELGELDIAFRLLGDEAGVPWSSLWVGLPGDRQNTYVQRATTAAAKLDGLPFHFEVSQPHGFPPSEIRRAVERVRGVYPEPDGPGSRPMLVVVDFLQLVGDEPRDEQELRARVGRASYVLRDLANRLNLAVLCISSVARERYKLLNELQSSAGLIWDADDNGCPIKRRVLNPDSIVGTGKESGEIEYSADSVSVIARVPERWDGTGCDVIFVTAKGRATGPTWSPLHFTGFRYEECSDRGGRLLEAWAKASEKKEREREAKDEQKMARIRADADAIHAYVKSHPGCSVREARVHAVNNQARRWNPAVALLGSALREEAGKGGKKHLSVVEPPG